MQTFVFECLRILECHAKEMHFGSVVGQCTKMIKNSATHIAKNALAQDMLTPVRKTRVAACCAQRSPSSCTGKPPSAIRNLGVLMKPSQKRKVLCEPRGYVE